MHNRPWSRQRDPHFCGREQPLSTDGDGGRSSSCWPSSAGVRRCGRCRIPAQAWQRKAEASCYLNTRCRRCHHNYDNDAGREKELNTFILLGQI